MMKISEFWVKISKDRIPYSPSSSTFKGKFLFSYKFIDFFIAAVKSQIKVCTTSPKASKDLAPYDPSTSTFQGNLPL